MRVPKGPSPLLPLPEGLTGLAAEEVVKTARTRHISRDRLDSRDAKRRTFLPGIRERNAFLPGDLPNRAIDNFMVNNSPTRSRPRQRQQAA